MSLARLPVSTVTTLSSPTVTAGEPLSSGQAVAIVYEGGASVARPAGAYLTDYARLFAGFSVGTYSTSQPPALVVARGALVTPLVQGAAPLIPNFPVFLSTIPGQVTQVAPTATGSIVLPLGTAVSTTEMMLTTDYRVINP